MQEFAEQSKDFSNADTFEMTVSDDVRRKPNYGRLVVIFENDRFLITLGPDYICFILAMIVFIILDILTIKQVFHYSNSIWLRALTLIGAISQVVIYLLVAISNPGITTSVDFDTETEEQYKRFCKICDLPMLPRSRHCSQCNVCIKGYDHHCPWTSKCIGQNNLTRFYVFASYIPIYICYCVIVLALVSD